MKTFDLAAALDDLRAWPATPVLTIQNGVGAEDLVAAARPGIAHVAGSLTAPVERSGRTRCSGAVAAGSALPRSPGRWTRSSMRLSASSATPACRRGGSPTPGR